jgi:hypothetical protein
VREVMAYAFGPLVMRRVCSHRQPIFERSACSSAWASGARASFGRGRGSKVNGDGPSLRARSLMTIQHTPPTSFVCAPARRLSFWTARGDRPRAGPGPSVVHRRSGQDVALPLAFVLGLQAWLGFAIVSAIAHFLRRVLSSQPRESIGRSPPGRSSSSQSRSVRGFSPAWPSASRRYAFSVEQRGVVWASRRVLWRCRLATREGRLSAVSRVR